MADSFVDPHESTGFPLIDRSALGDELARFGASLLQAGRLKVDAEVAKSRGDLDLALWLQANKDNIMLVLTLAGVVLAALALRRR